MRLQLLHRMISRMDCASSGEWGGRIRTQTSDGIGHTDDAHSYREERGTIILGDGAEVDKIQNATDREDLGFYQLTTPDDSPHFGIWYSVPGLQILIYTEGDVTWESYSDDANFWSGIGVPMKRSSSRMGRAGSVLPDFIDPTRPVAPRNSTAQRREELCR